MDLSELAVREQSVREAQFHDRGLRVSVALPAISQQTHALLEAGFQIFYLPPSHIVSYEAWMAVCGQVGDWTTDAASRARIGWEPEHPGYWFATDVAGVPQVAMGTSGPTNVPPGDRFLSLEEYALVWGILTDPFGVRFDEWSRCLLRTRYDGDGFLFAGSDDSGRLEVTGGSAAGIRSLNGSLRGRVATRIPNAG